MNTYIHTTLMIISSRLIGDFIFLLIIFFLWPKYRCNQKMNYCVSNRYLKWQKKKGYLFFVLSLSHSLLNTEEIFSFLVFSASNQNDICIHFIVLSLKSSKFKKKNMIIIWMNPTLYITHIK